MKEDKLDQEIAASLKKKLVEASVPYELGAWEGFQKRRAQRQRRAIVYWASGIAASLLLILVGVGSVDLSGDTGADMDEVQLAEITEKATQGNLEEFPVTESETENPLPEIGQGPSAVAPDSKPLEKEAENQKAPSDSQVSKALAVVTEPTEKTAETGGNKVVPNSPTVSNEKAVGQVKENMSVQQPPLISQTEEPVKQSEAKPAGETLALAKAEEPVSVSVQEQFVSESDFPAIEKEKASVQLGMGVSPGFGTIQSDNQMATAATIGVGMLVDIKLPGKFTLGSGLGLNYLSQNTEAESTIVAFGNTYPQTEKLEVRQMQVEMPVFVKYPVTKNNSVSIQAGFSNYYALNESASQENRYDRQVAEYSNDALGVASVSLKNEAVNSTTSLEPTANKFYPFATVNFGVNLRILESKGASYVIMPFYNYQLKQVSGYGDTYGLFGASFKMNFGGSGK